METYHIRFHHLIPLYRADVLDESLNVIPGASHDGGDQRHAKFGKESVGNQSGVGEVRTYKGYFFYIHYPTIVRNYSLRTVIMLVNNYYL